MSGLDKDTIGGYNSLLKKQKEESGEAVITTVLFDDKYELLHDRINMKGIKEITEKEYFVRGCTALLDAIGLTINKIGNAIEHTIEAERPEKVLFVITTDGMENASREYGYDKVKAMIEQYKEKSGWEFLFIGANIDAISTASKFGISPDRAANYHADSQGTGVMFESINEAVCMARACASPQAMNNWKGFIDEDYKKRKKYK